MDAWCSLTPSRDDGRLWAPLGGGHGDYAGNEGYVADLMVDAPLWRLLRRPSGALPDAAIAYSDGSEGTGVYSDGRLRGSHTYNNIIHIPGGNKLFMGVLSAPFYNPSPAGGVVQKSWYIDGETGEHSLASDYTALTQASGTGEGGAYYDPVRNCVWHIRTATSSNMILKTDLATGVTTKHGYADAWVGGSSRFVRVPGHDVAAHITAISGGSGLSIWNPATETWKRKANVAGSPSAGLFNGAQCGGYAGGDWVDSVGGIVLWNNDAPYSAELSVLTPPATDPMNGTWTWSVMSPDAANTVIPPPRVGGTGGPANIFGRFGYLPALKGFYLQTQASAQMHFFAIE
ncbi:MAG: hypothetical protein C0423_19850 [Methylibium sp.]|nr:hypothetical protein [Methylibium sp.]